MDGQREQQERTPGPWKVVATPASSNQDFVVMAGRVYVASVCHAPNDELIACLIAAAPDLLAEVEREYAILADYRFNWHGRSTAWGQAKLARLRDLLMAATGRDAESVQDDYGTRQARNDKAPGDDA